MAVYKVIQDIEAEDKLLGPLTLKSFIYAAIAGLLIFINVRLLIGGVALSVKLIFLLITFFPMLLFGVLASPLGRDQPTEVWLLSHIRFLLKQRKRIWDQSGISNLVTITVPKKISNNLTDGLSQTEVQSRLQALASTLDSRGWVVKNSTVNLGGIPGYLDESGGDSDRLIGTSSMPQQAAVVDIHPADDIMDEENNVTAQNFNQLMQKADDQRRQTIQDKINTARQAAASSDSRFLDDTATKGSTTFVGKAIVAPGSDDVLKNGEEVDFSEEAAAEAVLQRQHQRDAEIHRRSASFHPKNAPPEPVVTAASQAAKLELAQSGNDLSVASIAQLANRPERSTQVGPGEIVVALH